MLIVSGRLRSRGTRHVVCASLILIFTIYSTFGCQSCVLFTRGRSDVLRHRDIVLYNNYARVLDGVKWSRMFFVFYYNREKTGRIRSIKKNL